VAKIWVKTGDGRRVAVSAAPLVGGAVALLLVGVLGLTSWFQVEPDAVGVVTRFGRLERQVEPGLHWKLPFGIEHATSVATKHVHKMEFGFRSVQWSVGSTRFSGPGDRTRYSEANFGAESLLLTGDLNAAEVEWIVQYRIGDPVRYLFRVADPEETLRDLSQAVMSLVIGDHSVLEVLTAGRREINLKTQVELQRLCDQYEMGLSIETVQLQNVDPPEAVRASFNDVNQAEQEKARTINEARQEYNRKIPLAQGEAARLRQEAEGYAAERVNRAQGEVSRFIALAAEHERAPELLERRLWLETLAKVLPALERKVIVDDSVRGVLPHLDLGDVMPEGDR
jgi:membrane protease subunit HflK